MVNGKKALKIAKLRGEPERKKYNVYLHREQFQQFRALCKKQDVSSGLILEELMSQYIEQTKRLK